MTNLEIFLIGTILVLIVVGYYFISNLQNQIDQLEQQSTDVIAAENKVINVYRFILNILVKTLSELNKVDKRGSFSSDDEVGFAFKTIKELIEHCKVEIQRINPVESQDITGE